MNKKKGYLKELYVTSPELKKWMEDNIDPMQKSAFIRNALSDYIQRYGNKKRKAT